MVRCVMHSQSGYHESELKPASGVAQDRDAWARAWEIGARLSGLDA